MLLDYFQLFEQPFGVTPDPRFLYLGSQHREALASLVYTTDNNRGFVALIAKPGMGKTSLLYNYLEMLRNRARTAFVFRTDCNAREFIRHVLLDLGIDAPMDDLPAMHDALNRVLMDELHANRRFVLVIDEAQNLSESVLESIRLLSNFETPWMKLMHIVLAGQPQLADELAKPSMTQLRQRISQIIRIEPFTTSEVSAYMDRRLQAAGCQDLSLFTDDARNSIARYSEGIPRNVNNICFNALSLACAMQRKVVDSKIVDEVMRDLALEFSELGGASSSQELQRDPAGESQRGAVKGKSHKRSRWIPKFAASVVFLGALVFGLGTNAFRSSTPTSSSVIEGVPQSAPAIVDKLKVLTTNTFVTVDAASTVPSSSGSVIVNPGQTLFQISNENLGRYDSKVLGEIQKLNPWLVDPNDLPAGRELVLPHLAVASAVKAVQ